MHHLFKYLSSNIDPGVKMSQNSYAFVFQKKLCSICSQNIVLNFVYDLFLQCDNWTIFVNFKTPTTS